VANQRREGAQIWHMNQHIRRDGVWVGRMQNDTRQGEVADTGSPNLGEASNNNVLAILSSHDLAATVDSSRLTCLLPLVVANVA